MSSQYKLKKYLNKLENATSDGQMDAYYAKIKQYKSMQSGGVRQGPWRADLKPKFDAMQSAEAANITLRTYIDGKQTDISGLEGKLKGITDGVGNIEESLEDALLYLKEVSEAIVKSGVLDVTVLDPVFQRLTGIDIKKYPAIEPAKLWDWIFNGKLTADDLDAVNKLDTVGDRENKAQELIAAKAK